MESKETCRCEYGIWRTTKNSWALDWKGSLPPQVKPPPDTPASLQGQLSVGTVFFKYEKILLFFRHLGIKDFYLIEPCTEVNERKAWELVLNKVKASRITYHSTRHQS